MKGTQFYGNVRQSPRWAGDFLDTLALERFPAKLDPAQFADQGGIQVVVAAGGAAASATSVPVNALTLSLFASTILIGATNVVIPAGSLISFPGVGSKKFMKTTADAKIGDTAIAVEAIPTALVAGDTGSYNWWNGKTIQSGTLVGRTLIERNAGTPLGPGDPVTPDDELFLVAFDIPNLNTDNDVALVRPDRHFTVKENYLPGFGTAGVGYGTTTSPTAALTWVRAHHKCVVGQD